MMVDRVFTSIPFSRDMVAKVCPYSFSAKKDPQMGAEEGGDKRGLHLKDKFFQTTKEVKMDSWDITMRQSDYELNLLKIVVKIQLKKVNFSAFNVT